jgi:hypothetical protein
LLGAHIGGLVGGLSQTNELGDTGDENDVANEVPVRKSGMMVAVAISDDEHLNRAIDLLRSLGASDIERADGTIENGDWSDFDPIAPPTLVNRGAEHRA